MEIELAIGRSIYKINCAEGEEQKLLRLAERLNKKVNNLSLSFRGIDEKTLLVIAALEMQEKLENVATQKENSVNVNDDGLAQINEQDLYDALSDNLENIADYIEKLITKIRNY